MLNTLLKCPNKFVSSAFLKGFLDPDTKIKTYGLKAGHVETDLHLAGFDVTMTTNRYYVWEFWNCLIENPWGLRNAIDYYHKQTRTEELSYFKAHWFTLFNNPQDRAAVYYLLNRYSRSGSLECSELSKHNFSKFNLVSFEKSIPLVENLNLSFTSHENLIFSFKKIEDSSTILIPVGKAKRNYILNKEVKTIDSSNYNLKSIKKYLNQETNKMVLVFKYDDYVDDLFDKKIYINKFGAVTEDRGLAEDLIVTNIKYE